MRSLTEMMGLFGDRVWRVNEGPQSGGHAWAGRSGVWGGMEQVWKIGLVGRRKQRVWSFKVRAMGNQIVF